MGDFEVFLNYVSVIILGVVVYNVINCSTLWILLRRFTMKKIARRDCYECGFRPLEQEPIEVPIQFLKICVFFLMYDMELIFLFPFTSSVSYEGLYDILLFSFFFFLLFLSLYVDYERNAIEWQYT